MMRINKIRYLKLGFILFGGVTVFCNCTTRDREEVYDKRRSEPILIYDTLRLHIPLPAEDNKDNYWMNGQGMILMYPGFSRQGNNRVNSENDEELRVKQEM